MGKKPQGSPFPVENKKLTNVRPDGALSEKGCIDSEEVIMKESKQPVIVPLIQEDVNEYVVHQITRALHISALQKVFRCIYVAVTSSLIAENIYVFAILTRGVCQSSLSFLHKTCSTESSI